MKPKNNNYKSPEFTISWTNPYSKDSGFIRYYVDGNFLQVLHSGFLGHLCYEIRPTVFAKNIVDAFSVQLSYDDYYFNLHKFIKDNLLSRTINIFKSPPYDP